MKQVLGTGDVSVDHHIYKGIRSYPMAPEKLGSTIQSSTGGFFLLYDLLSAISKQSSSPEFGVSAGIERPRIEDVAAVNHGYASWKPYKRGKDKSVWCVDELLGYGPGDPLAGNSLKTTAENNLIPEVLVIDDAALGFRFQKELWPACIQPALEKSKNNLEWIVLKMSYPVMQGDLWGHLSKSYADNRVILRAGEHCAHVLAGLLTSLEMTELQLDELWTFVKKRKILATPKTLSASTGGRGSGRPSTHPPAC